MLFERKPSLTVFDFIYIASLTNVIKIFFTLVTSNVQRPTSNVHLANFYFLLSFLFVISTTAYTQGNTQTFGVEENLFKANLLFIPSVVYERAIRGNFVAKAELGVSLTIFDNFGDTSVGIFPKVEGQLKYYYNLKRRFNKGKNISNNSGSFVATAYQFQDRNAIFNNIKRSSNFSYLGGVWGFQKSYNSGLSLLFEVGLGYDFGYVSNNNPRGRPFPLLGFELGWVLF